MFHWLWEFYKFKFGVELENQSGKIRDQTCQDKGLPCSFWAHSTSKSSNLFTLAHQTCKLELDLKLCVATPWVLTGSWLLYTCIQSWQLGSCCVWQPLQEDVDLKATKKNNSLTSLISPWGLLNGPHTKEEQKTISYWSSLHLFMRACHLHVNLKQHPGTVVSY